MLLQWIGLADNWARAFQFDGVHLQEGERWSSGGLLLHQCVIGDGNPEWLQLQGSTAVHSCHVSVVTGLLSLYM